MTLCILLQSLPAFQRKSTAFWDITPYSPLKVNRRFGYHLHIQSQISRVRYQHESRWQAEMGAIYSSETSVGFQQTTRRYIPEDRTFHKHCCLFRVEAGSNTSTVTLRVVGGDEKGSLESETVKYGHESQGARTLKWLRLRGPAAIVNDRPVLSSERRPHINKLATVWQQ
jgi:hypothetical protein